MDNRAPSMLKPTMIAGLTAGVLTSIPGIDVLNFCTCCSLVVLAGFLGSYLYSNACRDAGAEFKPGSGALVGLVTGAFWAVSSTIVGAIFFLAVGNPAMKSLLEWMLDNPDLPPEAMDSIEGALETLEDRSFGAVKLILGFFQSVIIGAIFSTIGGLIGGAVFKQSPPVAPATDGTPPPPAGSAG